MKLSDDLVLAARQTAAVAERSIAGQIEYWAQLGQAVEPMLRVCHAEAIKAGRSPRPLAECLGSADSPVGRKRVAKVLATRPFPHYDAAGRNGLVVRIDADGRRTVGRFVNRRFVAAS